jgi:hypothetical protein
MAADGDNDDDDAYHRPIERDDYYTERPESRQGIATTTIMMTKIVTIMMVNGVLPKCWSSIKSSSGSSKKALAVSSQCHPKRRRIGLLLWVRVPS